MITLDLLTKDGMVPDWLAAVCALVFIVCMIVFVVCLCKIAEGGKND